MAITSNSVGGQRALPLMNADEFVTRLLAGQRDFSRLLIAQVDLNLHPGGNAVREYLQRTYHTGPPLDVSGADLRDISADQLAINGLIANDTLISRCSFPYLKAYTVQLRDSSLTDLNLSYLNASALDLRRSRSHRLTINRACIEQLHADDATFMELSSKGAGLGSSAQGLTNISFNRAHIRFSDIQDADLSGSRADFSGVEMLKTNMRRIRFGASRFAYGSLVDCDISGSNLHECEDIGLANIVNVTATAEQQRRIKEAIDARKYFSDPGA